MRHSSDTDSRPEVKVDETDWEYEHEQTLVDEDLKLIADKLRADETKKMVNAVEVGRDCGLADRSERSSVNCWSRSKSPSANRPLQCGTPS